MVMYVVLGFSANSYAHVRDFAMISFLALKAIRLLSVSPTLLSTAPFGGVVAMNTTVPRVMFDILWMASTSSSLGLRMCSMSW